MNYMSTKIEIPQSGIPDGPAPDQPRKKTKFRQEQSPGRVKFGRIDADLAEVESAAARSRDYIFSQQDPAGFWCGEREFGPVLEADYIFAHILLGTGDQARLERAFTEILRYQNADGGWSI